MVETRDASPYSDEEDIISKLPDELIQYILSFVPTRNAVQTCVLSKRWIHIWKSISYLSIKRSSFPEGKDHDQRFINFVDMVFSLGNKSSIQRFDLDWRDYSTVDIVSINVNRWIVEAVERNVEEMSLDIRQDHLAAFEIPHQLLNSKSLMKLELQVNFGDICTDVVLPKSMDLPRLKVMWLHWIAIPNEELSKNLFTSCPVLQELELFHCDIPNLTVNSSSLEKFVYRRFYSTMPNVIKLNAPNLKCFSGGSYVTEHYSLENCSLLSNVTFRLVLKEQRGLGENEEVYWNFPSEEKNEYAKRLMNFLGAEYMVEDLSLSFGFLEVLSGAPDLLYCQTPRLCNLQHLGLQMRSTRGCLQAIVYLLKISPRIHSIFLCSNESNIVDVGDDWEAGLSCPGMLSHLEHVIFREMEGCDAELKLLSFLLKHAKVLRRLAVFFRSSVGSQVKQFRDNLRALPAASSNIRMMFL